MNNYRMLAAAHDWNAVVNALHETNSKIISLTKTIARRQLAIASNFADLNQSIPIKDIVLNTFFENGF